MPRGKCDACRVRWSWQGRPRVADALCPSCRRPLAPTSQNSLLPQLSAYATTGIKRSGPKYLNADPTEISTLRRKLKAEQRGEAVRRRFRGGNMAALKAIAVVVAIIVILAAIGFAVGHMRGDWDE